MANGCSATTWVEKRAVTKAVRVQWRGFRVFQSTLFLTLQTSYVHCTPELLRKMLAPVVGKMPISAAIVTTVDGRFLLYLASNILCRSRLSGLATTIRPGRGPGTSPRGIAVAGKEAAVKVHAAYITGKVATAEKHH
ncbi:hypothetical protein B0H11DRAFT_1916521 [Mycena galericulata]|nr:hypothetical protein B0H11DRAFT_1916521 [Mycena galericulata]